MPVAWIGLVERLQSRVLYKECVIHVVGRYNELREIPAIDIEGVAKNSHCMLDMLETRTRKLIDEKHQQLIASCQEAQKNIMSYYPPNLHRRTTTGRADRDPIGRADYGNDVWSWMALALYRHWFGQLLIMVCHTHDRTIITLIYRRMKPMLLLPAASRYTSRSVRAGRPTSIGPSYHPFINTFQCLTEAKPYLRTCSV